jgi:ABC-2 type transport system ATP-binding protein
MVVMEPRLELTGVVRTFSSGDGVLGVDLRVEPGEVHALVGLNGAGKTTLLRLALGMLRPRAGGVRISGTPLDRLGAGAWARVGHLVDGPLAYPELTVHANLGLAATLHAVPRAEIRRRVDEAVAELGLEAYAGRRTRALSQGNLQRLGLAAALLHGPELLVLDEPTTALDPRGVILLRGALERRAAAGAGILVSSHHLDEVARIADRITVLNAGRCAGSLDPAGADLERAFFRIVHDDDERRLAPGTPGSGPGREAPA